MHSCISVVVWSCICIAECVSFVTFINFARYSQISQHLLTHRRLLFHTRPRTLICCVCVFWGFAFPPDDGFESSYFISVSGYQCLARIADCASCTECEIRYACENGTASNNFDAMSVHVQLWDNLCNLRFSQDTDTLIH